MDREELLDRLHHCEIGHDEQEAHILADSLLLEYINDKEISEAFDLIKKWYA